MPHSRFRHVLQAVAVVVACTSLSVPSAVGAPTSARVAPPKLVSATYLDTLTLPDSLQGSALRLGGLSGIDDLGGGNYVAVSDDPGKYGPARFYTFRLSISASGHFRGTAPIFTGGGTVLGPGNKVLGYGERDMEGIRRLGSNIVVTSEGAHPFVRVVRPPGLFVRDLPIPAAYRPGPGTGLGENTGFEGLAVTPNGRVAVMTETALAQDGPAPTHSAGTSSRLLMFGAGNSRAEFVYRTNSLAPDASDKASKGVSDLLAISSTEFITIERGFDPVTGHNDVKLFATSTRGATLVTDKRTLSGSEAPMAKKMMFDFDSVPSVRSDNVEGIATGPRLADGRRTLVLISDDNFNHPTQHTKIHLLAIA